MAKGRKQNRNKKYNYGNNKFDLEAKKIIIMAIVVLAVLGLFYLLTLAIVNKKPTISTEDSSETTIQYSEILAGSSFSQKKDSYLVVFYDTSSEDSDMNSIVASYSGELTLYTVDLADSLNKSVYSTEGSNPSATQASELKVTDPTVIKFTNNAIEEYIETYDSVKEYLS